MDADGVQLHYARSLDASEEHLLRQFAASRSCSDVFVAPFQRFGMSGAKLLLGYFAKERKGNPFIFKLNTRQKIEREYLKAKEAKIRFSDDVDLMEPVFVDGRGLVCSKHMTARGGYDPNNVLELKSFAYDQGILIADCVSLVEGLYARVCDSAYCHADIRRVAIEAEYENPWNYVRRSEVTGRWRGSVALLIECFGHATDVNHRGLDIGGKNPLVVLDALLQCSLDLCCGPIHGDLHTSNIVIAEYPSSHPAHMPFLIDFAWHQQQGHLYKDFVLLENSIRFMDCPRSGIHSRDNEFTQILADEGGPEKLLSIVSASSNLSEAYLGRMAHLVSVIRSSAKTAVGVKRWDYEEYMISQFLVLTGQLVNPEYDFREAVRTLTVIGTKLVSSGRVKLP